MRPTLVVEQSVRRFDVTMDEALFVGEAEGVRNQSNRLSLRQPPFGDTFGKVRSFDQISHYEALVAVTTHVMHADDARVPQLRRRRASVMKASDVPSVGRGTLIATGLCSSGS